MAQSLLLDTTRLTIVGINDIRISQLTEYFTNNIEHLKSGGGSVPQTEEQVQNVYENWFDSILDDREVRFFIILEDHIIGIVGVSNIVRGAFHAAYLGYNLAEAHQSKGYMTEALRVIIEFCFSALNIHRLMANYRPENTASERVLEKLNFVREGIAKDYLMVNGQWADHVLTSLTNIHWQPITK
jgi:ribosomal-protein-alanine N-acetyltransferase